MESSDRCYCFNKLNHASMVTDYGWFVTMNKKRINQWMECIGDSEIIFLYVC